MKYFRSTKKQLSIFAILSFFLSGSVFADFNPQVKWSKPILIKKEEGFSVYEVGKVSNLLDMSDSENTARLALSGPIFTFNTYTFSGDQVDWYFRYGSTVKHSIFSCNVSPKTISVFARWNVQGAESWNYTWNTTFEAGKCYYFNSNRVYSYKDYYSFVGAVYAKGYSANFMNTDSSKFIIY